MQLFIASTRKGETGAAAQTLSADGVHIAFDILTIPPGHRAGSIEEPMWGAGNAHDDIVLVRRAQLDGDEFRAELASHISGRIGANRDVLGVRPRLQHAFEEARERAAQIVADSRFGGVAVLFTWPTKHELFGYVSDKDNATASRDALQSLLQDIAATPGVGKVHVLAHSMGGWMAMEALRQEAISGDRDLDGHLGEVMLASPDIDMDVFAAQMAISAGQGHRLRDRQRPGPFPLERDRPVAPAGRRDQPVQSGGSPAAGGLGAKVYDLRAFPTASSITRPTPTRRTCCTRSARKWLRRGPRTPRRCPPSTPETTSTLLSAGAHTPAARRRRSPRRRRGHASRPRRPATSPARAEMSFSLRAYRPGVIVRPQS